MTLAPLMAEQQTPLLVEMPDEAMPIYGDPARLQQIQANLLSNASRYSAAGREVRFSLLRDGEDAVIRVVDHRAPAAAASLATDCTEYTE
jgi:signal transduction histidine kinase